VVHAAAWKETFDGFLEARGRHEGHALQPFDIQDDYRRYVDGKSRYDGVRAFLKARAIELPEGDPDDSPERQTVCGLGNRKNELFLQHLGRDGVDVYPDAELLIRRLQGWGVRVAVVSASRNCAAVLDAAGLRNLFDMQLDGVLAAELGLEGKPAPDIFLEVAKRFGIDVAHAAVVEDSLAGVEAGERGGFGLVVGVDRDAQAAALRASGADVVVRDLGGLAPPTQEPCSRQADPPSALHRFEEIEARLEGRSPALFLDYDGTLTEIAERPEDAILAEDVRDLLRELAQQCPVAIVSGRDLQTVSELVGVAGLGYIGSHGFDISGPTGTGTRIEVALEYLEALDAAERELRARVEPIQGSQVERKKFSIATHFRRVGEQEQRVAVKNAIEEVLSHHPDLTIGHGHEVLEVLPRVDWNKGRAVLWLLEELELDAARVCPMYVGDDATDENAFVALRGRGIGIVVKSEPRPTAAEYALRDPAEVVRWLHRLRDKLRGESH
jgi:alpha,alpha-trehalase